MARPQIASILLASLLAGCAATTQVNRPPSVQDRLRLAAAAEANNNVEVALSIYRNAALAEPDNAEVQARYASALARQGAHREAALVLEQALARRPRDRTLLLALARSQMRMNDLRGAAQTYDRLLDQAPGDPDGLNGLGVIADLSGDHHLAQRRYRDGLSHAPAHEGLRNNLALSLALSGETVKAVQLLRGLREDGNMDVRVRHNLAFVHAMKGDHATAHQLAGAELDPMEQRQLVAAASALAAVTRPSSAASAPTAIAAPVASVAAEVTRASEPAPEPAPVTTAPAVPTSAPPAPTPRDARIVLQARAETWIEVREQDSGRVVFDRVLGAGETYHVPDRPGLVLTTGNAAGLAVTVDGDTLPAFEGRVRRGIPLEPAAIRQAATPRAPTAVVAVEAAAPERTAPAAAAAPRRVGATDAPILLRARSETWVQVRPRDTDGVVFDRVMQPGETYPVPNRSDLVMTVGNAAGLEVIVQGETLPPLGREGTVRRDLALEPEALRQAALRRAPPAETGHPAATSVPADPIVRRGRVLLQARGETWVQVRDRHSQAVLFDRVMRAGDTYAVPARSGLLLTTGNAGGLDVVVEGETLPPLGGEAVVRRDVSLDPDSLRGATLAGAR